MHDASPRRRYRSIFLSDVHLGTKGARGDFLVDFLRRVECERLYLVGDIVDGWRLKRSWYWDADHDEVIRLVLRMARHGTEVIYIPCNHDEMFRDWLGLEGAVGQPRITNPKRPVEGFACTRSEVSGQRLWGLFRARFGAPEAVCASANA